MADGWFGRESPLRVALLAVVVGVLAGFGALVFRGLTALFHNLFFLGDPSFFYDAKVHTPASPWGPWIILVPGLGALAVAFIVKRFAPETRGAGVSEVIDAVYYQRGKIRPSVAVFKTLAASISLGSGGSIGREGPIIQIGASFGSTLGQLIRMPEWERIALIACGAGGGIAATFNAPIGGILFAIEIIMIEVSARTLVPVALATGAATLVSRYFFGDYPAFVVPSFPAPTAHLTPVTVFVAYVVLGIIIGLVSVAFIRAIYLAESLFDRMPGNYYTRHFSGMLLVGLTIYWLQQFFGHYYVQGVGYSTIQEVLGGTLLNPELLLLLFVLKLLVTALTLGSGGSGGVFSPSLFIGAALGGGYGVLVNYLLPASAHIDATEAAIAGMAAVAGSATGAVLTAVVMLFELTRDYNVIVPLLITTSLAYGLRKLILPESIYILKLHRRGHFIPEFLQTNLYMLRSAAETITTATIRMEADEFTRRLPSIESGRSTPHLLLVSRDHVQGVVPSHLLEKLFLENRTNGDCEMVLTDYIVIRSDDIIPNILTRLREAHCDAALLTETGQLDSADQVTGILTWHDLAQSAALPGQFSSRA